MRYVLAFILASVSLFGQQIRPLPSAKIYGELVKLKTLTSVLYVAAHPDDENTRLLSWLATGRHIRTGYLSITRGDGGQNIIGGEQGAALGLIRTYELLEARKLDGAEQYFGRAVDFGFSKNPEETFKQWDRIALTADVVRAIRLFKPDVVICRFPKDSMAGHGQHSASAILAEDAVKYLNGTLDLPATTLKQIEAAATRPYDDPSQIDWKPTRLLFNAFRFGNRSTVREGMFKLDVGQYDPTIGMGYGELAGISRSIHRSQGAGTPSTPGIQPEFFATIMGAPATKSLFDGIDTTWNRIGRADIGRDIDAVIAAFDMQHPERSVDALLKIRRKIAAINDAQWRDQKLDEINTIILSCIGLTADASVSAPMVAIGATDSLTVNTRLTIRAGKPVRVLLHKNVNDIQQLTSSKSDDEVRPVIERTCDHDSLIVVPIQMSNSELTYFGVTQPYWLKGGMQNALFATGDLWSHRTSQSSIVARIMIDTDPIYAVIPISTKKLDPLRGDVIEELRIVPPVSIEPITSVVVGMTTPQIQVRVRAYANVSNAKLYVKSGPATLATISGISIRANTDTLITVIPTVESNATVTVSMEVNDKTYQHQVKTITYDHLPTLQYLEPANVKVVAEKVTFTAKKIAFIAGAGEYAPEFLRTMGVSVDDVSDEIILKTNELLKYDAVLVGIRAINTRKSMKYLMPALMQYVERGGTLVMQYNTLQDMSTKDLGPYPMPLANKRVTEEDAVVSITKPTHRLLSYPNAITAADFDGWVQERGLYFPFEYDQRYEALLSMHDTNESPLTGSLLYANYGKGHYVYCALSLFRQLPAGVPGGIKLFANMLSIGK